MEPQIKRVKFTLTNMGLNEYQASALAHLMYIGETKATTLSKASGVPQARIYGVLEELSQMGLVIVRPGRPAYYSPMSPQEISDALMEDAKDEIMRRLSNVESYRSDFQAAAEDMYLKGGGLGERIPLLRIVSLGKAALEETKKLYTTVSQDLMIMTRAMEYLPQVKEELEQAIGRGVNVRVLMRSRESLSASDAETRDAMIQLLEELPGDSLGIKVSDIVPIRGCIIDPERGGRALFMVEEEGVPYTLREAAVTSHPGVVKGLASLFDLKWRYDSSKLK
jgi:sugar-specific transcriptional regulator TrmB